MILVYSLRVPHEVCLPGSRSETVYAMKYTCRKLIIIIIIVTGLESYTRCASRAHVVRLYMP